MRFLQGAQIKEMFDNLVSIFQIFPSHQTWNIRNNDTALLSHQQIVNDLLSLKHFINGNLSNCKVILLVSRVKFTGVKFEDNEKPWTLPVPQRATAWADDQVVKDTN